MSAVTAAGEKKSVTHTLFDINEAWAPYAANLLPAVNLPSVHYPI